MNHQKIIISLSRNLPVFKGLFSGLTEEEYLWKQAPEKWCLLEILCHLYDEEREDFKGRTKQVLETPEAPLQPIDPQGWVKSRKYMEQNYNDKLNGFLTEREASVEWLQNLSGPAWNNAYVHPKFGRMSAQMFLANWLAHDYLHIRQILTLKYDYLKQLTDEDIGYAGNW